MIKRVLYTKQDSKLDRREDKKEAEKAKTEIEKRMAAMLIENKVYF